MHSCTATRSTPLVNQQSQITNQQLRIDSVYLRDSIYIREFTRNDTVYIERWRDRWKNHEIVRIDTVYQTQTLTKTETITAKEVPRFYKWCTLFFWMLVILFLGYLIFRIMKAIYLRQ